jgi:hypothetical protein
VDEAQRLLRENPRSRDRDGPRNEGDGVTVGLDPAIATDRDEAVLASRGVIIRFPLFPEALSPPVPAAGVASAG